MPPLFSLSANNPSAAGPLDRAARLARFARCTLVMLALCVAALPGCGGCSQSPTLSEQQKKKDEEAKKEKPKPKPDFERLAMAPLPNDKANPLKAIKPGHWTAAALTTKANNFDFSGELDIAVTDAQGTLVNLERTPFRLTISRPATLSKGQNRRLECSLFVPTGGTRTFVTTHLRDRHSGREAMRDTEVFNHMPGYQYCLVGIVSETDRYRWLKVINSVRPPSDEFNPSGAEDSYYRVQLPKIGQTIPLPAESLCWTSLAYIVWDDIDPALFSPDQQQALLDWLHWGGQIVISGPKSLDLLRQSFLEPYLPAAAGKPRQIGIAELAAMNEYWTIPAGKSRPLVANHPWSAVTLDKREEARFVHGCGDLLAERRVGRGRIVVTAFRLVERDLMYWPSFDSFFNAALLGRPRRSYWLDAHSGTPSELTELTWTDFPERRLDPQLTCQLRYFARDAVLPDRPRRPAAKLIHEDEDPFADPPLAVKSFGPWTYSANALSLAERQREHALGDSGVAGWNDFGPVASEARDALKQAAGITIPRREFVFKVLLAYLAVLVPINWTIFRLLGRVEWAWVAAPLIAVACAAAVIWRAQLDIGFARSSTEIAVVELQGGYQRAHVARYTALYTSLSTTYDVHLDQPSALALPFATNPEFELLLGQQRTTVDFHREAGAQLTGYAVSSNATGMIHSEHMTQLPGALALEQDPQGAWRVANDTGLALRGAGVVRRQAEGAQTEMAWIGELDSGTAVVARFVPADDERFAHERDQASLTADAGPPNTLSLRQLCDLAENPAALAPGDVRLVAWLEGELPGIEIVPAAAQQRHAALVVANLSYGPHPRPQPDTNLPNQAKPISALEGEEGMEPEH